MQMGRWRSKLLTTLIIYFAGFASAIYALAPASDKERDRQAGKNNKNSYQAESKSEKFALAVNSGMRKCISFAEEKAVVAREFVKAELARRRDSE